MNPTISYEIPVADITQAASGQWWVYEAFNADGDLLYIGCTSNLLTRLGSHMRNAKRDLPQDQPGYTANWAREAHHFRFHHFGEHKQAARDDELYRIGKHQPPYNRVGKSGNSARLIVEQVIANLAEAEVAS